MSYVAWLDHSEHERRKMLNIIDLFREQDTRDELGLGGVRDAFADLMFPGTSTIQTRARYFLFIPWIYAALEAKRVPSTEIAVGPVGRRSPSSRRLRRVASTPVSSASRPGRASSASRATSTGTALRTWGVRRFAGPQDQYHRSLDRFYRLTSHEARNDDGEPVEGGLRRNWDPGLPPAPDGFPAGATLAAFQGRSGVPGRSHRGRPPEEPSGGPRSRPDTPGRLCGFPWEHPERGAFVRASPRAAPPCPALLWSVPMERPFSTTSCSPRRPTERTSSRGTGSASRLGTTRISRLGPSPHWDQTRFWKIALSGGARIGPRAQGFVTRWLSLVLPPGQARTIAENEQARQLILEREKALKGEQSRLTNQRALERWSGAAGTGQIDYRWGISQTILLDILKGQGEGHPRCLSPRTGAFCSRRCGPPTATRSTRPLAPRTPSTLWRF